MSDEFCQRLLNGGNTAEVLAWLRDGSETNFRSLGELGSTEESISLSEEMYTAGAETVTAVEIDVYDEDQNSGKLVIKLPTEKTSRDRLFRLVGKLAQQQGFSAEEDTGQSYLFVMLD